MSFSENEKLSTSFALQFVSGRDLEAVGVDQKLISAAMDRDIRGASFHSILDRWAVGRNITTRRTPTEKADLFIQACGRSEMMAAAGLSTINLGSIVDDSINKIVRVKFMSIPSVIPAVCRQIDNNDYRPISNYQLTSGSFLKRLGESGELSHMSVKDSVEKYEIEDSGGYLGIPRKYVVNDDLSILKSIGDLLGIRGKQTLERDFHLMLLNANWGSTNKLTGTESAFSYSALKLAHQLWANQESDGAPIAIGGSVLLLQSGAMELDGKDLNKSEKVMVRSDNTIDRTEANVFQGTLTNIVGTPWLRHSTMGGKRSATAWFEFSDPNVHSMFEVAYLGGPDGEGRVPRVETAQMPFTSLGLQMRVLFSYGMGQVDSVGAVYATGVAP